MIAPSRMERQGQGKVGMANESESLVEAALGRAWETADAQVFEQETALALCGSGYPMLTQQRGRLNQSHLLLLRNVVSPTGSGQWPVGEPQGTRNSLVGMGCRRKRRPAAERQREFITGWIGFVPGPKGR